MRFFSGHQRRFRSPQYRAIDQSQCPPVESYAMVPASPAPPVPAMISRAETMVIEPHPEYLTFLRDQNASAKFHIRYVGPVSLSIYKSHWTPT